MKKVLIPTKLDKIARQILTGNGNYEVVQEDSEDLEGLARRNPDAYAVIVRSNKVTPEIIDMLPNLKMVVRAGAGYNTIDIQYARKKGVDVMNTPGANSNAVAEEVVALMLADARHLLQADPSVRCGKWEKKKFMGREIANKTVGIIGLGYIGQLVARRLSGFEVKLLGYDPIISAARARSLDVELCDMETIFKTADYVTLHVPETDETRKMVNAKLLSLMKDGATLINTARSGIIDEEVLREARKSKKIRFLNDVYPKDAEGEKSCSDIADIMLPHLGASTAESNFNAARRAAEQIIDLDEKGIASAIVNRAVPEGLDEAYLKLANTLARLCRCMVGKSSKPKNIETSFYGQLAGFADWMLVPIVAGFEDDFDRFSDHQAALKFLKEMGINYLNREVDEKKGYGNSITVDMTADTGGGNLRHTSIRGTVAENVLMVSRINNFYKLYFEPAGPAAFFLYRDRPGVLGAIGNRLAEHRVNIEDIRQPHDPETGQSLAIVKLDKAIEAEVTEQIGKAIEAHVSFNIVF
jgi:D-3-phosphoglycerate dehydrogenase